MSGGPICARTDPSTNSTIEWTRDCGWITTSIRARSRPNRWWSSITSRALFIRVAEPTVIRGPMFQFGWRSAIAGVAQRISSGVLERNGPPLAAQALEDRGVLRIDGDDLAAAVAREGDELRAGHDERFLVRERQDPPALEHGDRRQESRRADDGVD